MDTVTRMNRLSYRAVWISDVHLGSKACKVDYLLDFLNSTHCDYLYLVGDIIDILAYKRGKFWSQKHTEVIHTILEKATSGTKVIYVPGNHDDELRNYTGHVFGQVEVHQQYVHRQKDGKQFLVLHGDEFDHVIQCGYLLTWLGDASYEILIKLNRWLNIARRIFKRPYWSLSSYLKNRVKKARQHIRNYESAVIAEARRRGMDGVICGHIHHPELYTKEGVLYCNDGDWVENCCSVVETHDGQFHLLYWTEQMQMLKSSTPQAVASVA
ncbi:MAG: UDP-2,3-diacylglucosamine diphosphatase, partial [Gammaproteobacteria bacterium]